MPYVLSAVAIVIIGALLRWLWRAEHRLTVVAIGLVLGGAVGNIIDRMRFGAVVDFLDFQRLGFFPWVFNVADAAITVGVVFLLLDSTRKEAAA